jgi:hypothetical protein
VTSGKVEQQYFRVDTYRKLALFTAIELNAVAAPQDISVQTGFTLHDLQKATALRG